MNKVLIGVGVIVLATIVWFLFQPDVIEYVAEVHDEVAALEAELAEIDIQVKAGTLSPEAAAAAQIKIVSQIDSINTTAKIAQNAKLTNTQRAQLVEGLERLKQVLIKYKTTLMAVDEAVLKLPESERPTLNRRGGSGNRSGVAIIATETIIATDEQIEEVIADITDEALAEEVANAVEDPESEDILEDEMSDENADASEETQIDSTETTEENVITDDETPETSE
ncbi:MAG TPA: hypothetical protein PKA42_02165 [Candidatus Paceibacterota bacterium]|nr:hypothetical protein [Candidatus Paceibacterota bacterium]HMO82949.1 hypothetical protein [Candidatus Paceibacterota bacterium]